MEQLREGIGRQRETLRLAGAALRAWTRRQVLAATVSGLLVALVIGLATVLIPNPVFSREIPTLPWNYPVWLLTSALMGMLIATYVQPASATAESAPRESPPADDGRQTDDAVRQMADGRVARQVDDRAGRSTDDGSERRSARVGGAAGILAWFAVGCPVCNKIALLALGYTGALTWFAPLQPFLAAIAVVLSVVAVLWRLRGQVACPVPAAASLAVAAR